MRISEKIKHLRKRTGLSQEEIAAALEVSQNLVSAWERGRAIPRLPQLAPLARLLKTTTDYLVSDEDEREGDVLDQEAKALAIIAEIGWREAYRRLINAPKESPAYTEHERFDQPGRAKDAG